MSARRHLREHFERSTGPVPPSLEADVRRRLVAAAPNPQPNWVMAAAAAVLALVIVGVLIYARAQSQQAVPSTRPSAIPTASWDSSVTPELVPPVGAAPICGSQLLDYVVAPTPPHATVTNLGIQQSAAGDAVELGIGSGYPSRIQVRLLPDGSAFVVTLWKTTVDPGKSLSVSPGPIQGVEVTDPNPGGTHPGAVLRIAVTGLACVKVVLGPRSLTMELSPAAQS